LKRYDLAGTGSMVVDHFVRAPRILAADEKVLLQDGGEPVIRTLVGGVMLNQLGWARILGLRVALFGKQADDGSGRFLRAGMDRLGIERHLDLDGSASSFAQILVDAGGGRAIYMSRGATGELTPADVDTRFRDVIESASVVTSEVSQVPLATVRRVFERARAAGAFTVVDLDVALSDSVPSLGTREELDAVLGLADVLKPSLGAVRGLVDNAENPEAVARELAERYRPEVVVVTVGERGSVVWAKDQVAHLPAARIDVVDSTGAGDAFLGGFIAGIHHGLDWSEAARLGNACGAACCEQLGAFPDDPAACRKRALEHFKALGGPTLRLDPRALRASPAASPVTAEYLEIARGELDRVAREMDLDSLAAAAHLVREREAAGGRLHVTGIGKPEHVARYAAAMFSSTGTPATFLHGTEATHGSVGQICPGDVVIAISNSGDTPELLSCVAAVRGMGGHVIAVTGRADSRLATVSDVVLIARVEREGGHLGLPPLTSVPAQVLVMSALAVELQSGRSFDRSDYHRRHPGGTLGRKASGRES
jgi:sugar/nucleoside kinase (ribokinase family)/D-arabinose 5-phosphate isomerase GutQ